MCNLQLTNSRQSSITLSDGRSLCWFESGPANGFPVIFCTGAGMSGSLGFGLELLEVLNIRLITPERPGLGDSSFHAQKSLHSFANDVQELLNSQNIQQYAVIGFSQGAVFAIALAHYGNPVTLSLVAGQDQFDHPATYGLLSKDVINLLSQAIDTPDVLTEWLTKNVTYEWLLAFILHCSAEIDQQIYNEDTFLAAYSDCMERAFSQGNQGYIQDLLLTFQPWGFKPEDIHCPVSLWYGELDASTVHSPDFGKTLATRFANCQHHIMENEGGSLLWTQAKNILTTSIKINKYPKHR